MAFEWADDAGGTHAAVDGAPPRLFRRPADAARLPHRRRPTPACRSRAWPNACSTRWPRPTPAGCRYYIVGHVGDGNFHVAYLIDPSMPAERETAERLNQQLVQRALRLDGTCTGEHGIGLHKMGFLVERGRRRARSTMMRTIKRALDPKNIMNPGKIFAAAPDGASRPPLRRRARRRPDRARAARRRRRCSAARCCSAAADVDAEAHARRSPRR